MSGWVILTNLRLSYVSQVTVTVKDRVKVALAGEEVNLEFRLAASANQSNFELVCYGLQRQVIQRWKIPPMVAEQTFTRKMKITAINSLMSGDYSCVFNETSKVFWTLLVRGECECVCDWKGQGLTLTSYGGSGDDRMVTVKNDYPVLWYVQVRLFPMLSNRNCWNYRETQTGSFFLWPPAVLFEERTFSIKQTDAKLKTDTGIRSNNNV